MVSRTLSVSKCKVAKRKQPELIRNAPAYAMCIPGLLYFLLFSYIPMAGIVLVFKDYNVVDGIFGSPWVAFKNFEYFFQSGKAWSVTRNTILYNLAFLCVNTFLQITCAILLSELAGKWFKRITQSVMFFPYFISWVVVGAFIYNMFNYEFGAVNPLLRSLGLDPVDIYSNKVVWPFILIAVSAFKNVGYGTVMYLASIMNIDGQLYEAADLDGANMWQKIRHITLPGIRPTVVILFVMSVGQLASVGYEKIYLLQNDLNVNVSEVISTYVYKRGIENTNYSFSAAVGLFNNVINIVLLLCANAVSHRLSQTSLF